MSSHLFDNDRLLDLLVQQTTDGLNEIEQRELTSLLSKIHQRDIEQFERTAAALVLTNSSELEELPLSLRDQLLAQARIEATKSNSPSPLIRGALARRLVASPNVAWLAAAASIAIAVVGWWPSEKDENALEPIDFVSQASPDQQTMIERRLAMLRDPHTVRRAWQKTQDPAASQVTGDVIWNTEQHMGYLRLRGLPVNDAQRQQYQLWIFDGAREDQYPVDGGVFNMPAYAAEVVIPIVAKLPVQQAAMFAITIEKPGGVVVSSRQRLVVISPT